MRFFLIIIIALSIGCTYPQLTRQPVCRHKVLTSMAVWHEVTQVRAAIGVYNGWFYSQPHVQGQALVGDNWYFIVGDGLVKDMPYFEVNRHEDFVLYFVKLYGGEYVN